VEGGRGCGAPALVGCALLLFLLSAGSLLFLYQADDMVSWAFDQSKQAILDALPEDLPEGERYRLERAYVEVVAAVLDNRVGPAELGSLQSAIADAQRAASSGELDREGVLDLIEALERAAGREGPTGDDRDG
jgi:hypothetical protein